MKNKRVFVGGWDAVWSLTFLPLIVFSVVSWFYRSSGCYSLLECGADADDNLLRVGNSYWHILLMLLGVALLGVIAFYYIRQGAARERPDEFPVPRFVKIDKNGRDPTITLVVLMGAVVVITASLVSASIKYSQTRVGSCGSQERGIVFGSTFLQSRIRAVNQDPEKYPGMARMHMIDGQQCIKQDEQGNKKRVALPDEYIWYLTDILLLLLAVVGLYKWISWYFLSKKFKSDLLVNETHIDRESGIE